MTSEARTCPVDVGACRCGEGREWHDHVLEHAYAGFCGLSLVDDETSPCAVCEHARAMHGPVTARCQMCVHPHMGDTFPRANPEHAYAPSASRCPVHGAAKEARDA